MQLGQDGDSFSKMIYVTRRAIAVRICPCGYVEFEIWED